MNSHRWIKRLSLFSLCGRAVTKVDMEVKVEKKSNIKKAGKSEKEFVQMTSLPQMYNTDAVMKDWTRQ